MSPAGHEVAHDAPPPSPRACEIVAGIADVAVREAVATCLAHALAALEDLQRLHLPQDDSGQPAALGRGGHHLELAPPVLRAVASIDRLLRALAAAFEAPAQAAGDGPSEAEFDLEFDLVDGPTGEAAGLVRAPARPARSGREAAAEAAYVFGGMLRSRCAHFGERLRHAARQADGWPLLAALDDHKHRLTKAVQGVIFGLLGAFAADVRREEILPAYRSAVGEAVALRAALADLSHHVGRFNTALAAAVAAGDATLPLVVGIADRLGRFCAQPAYRTLRADDKRAVIDFRAALHATRQPTGAPPTAALRLAVEGFSRFLESMHAINHREVLVLHDRQRLAAARARLEQAIDLTDAAAAAGELDAVVAALGAVGGRHAALDAARRGHAPVPPEAVAAALIRWQALVEEAGLGVG